MALSRVQLASFATPARVTAAAPGDFTTVVAGTLYPRRGGWAATDNVETHARWPVNSALKYAFYSWVWARSMGVNSSAFHTASILQVSKADGNALANAAFRGDKKLVNTFWETHVPNGAVASVALDELLLICLAWEWAANTITDRVYYARPGDSVMSALDSHTWSTGANPPAYAAVRNGNSLNGVNGPWLGRYATPALYTMASFADVVIPGDLPAPSLAGERYEFAAAGDEDGAGTLAAPYPATRAVIQRESRYCLPNDVLSIDTSGGEVVLTAPLIVGTYNSAGPATIEPAAAQDFWDVKPWTTLSAGGWSLTSGKTNVYESTDGGATDLAGVLVWEDGKAPHKPKTADYANEAALLTAMDAAASGEFWAYSSDTAVYVKPIGNTNPATNGRTYTRSRNLGSGASAVQVQSRATIIDGLRCRRTALSRKTDNDPYNAYGLQLIPGIGGAMGWRNCSISEWGKHAAGVTSATNDTTVTVTDNFYGPGIHVVVLGGQTALAFFIGESSITAGAVTITGDRCPANAMLADSADGTVNQSYAFSINHANGGSKWGAQVWDDVVACTAIHDQATTTGVTIRNCTLGGAEIGSPLTVEESVSTWEPFYSANAGAGAFNLRNVLMVVTKAITGNDWVTISCASGTWSNVTIDTRGNATATGSARSVFGRSGATTLTVRNLALLVDSGKDFTLFGGFSGADTLDLDYGGFQLGAGNLLLRSYGGANKTLAQSQALSKFTNAVAAADLKLDARWRPKGGSVLRRAGVAIPGVTTDLYGRTIGTPPDVGAAQYAGQFVVGLGGFNRPGSFDVAPGVTFP